MWGNKQIQDSILVLIEAVDFIKEGKQKGLVFKVDFEKAYDSILWDFLDDMMRGMHFYWKWRKWIRDCVSSASMSVLVNGSTTGEFQLPKGIRQGDPLSLFLFLIVVEGLSCLMRKVVEMKEYDGIEIGRNKILIRHLQFPDDKHPWRM